MAFNKFDPHAPEAPVEETTGERRAKLLRYGWWISVVYTTIGFGFIAYWLFQ